MSDKISRWARRFPLKLDGQNQEHLYVFCLILEHAMSQGKWCGEVGQG